MSNDDWVAAAYTIFILVGAGSCGLWQHSLFAGLALLCAMLFVLGIAFDDRRSQ